MARYDENRESRRRVQSGGIRSRSDGSQRQMSHMTRYTEKWLEKHSTGQDWLTPAQG